MNSLERAALITAINTIPDHAMGGSECEWDCVYRYPPDTFPECTWDNPEHQHELISRERVLALLAVHAIPDTDPPHGD